MRHSEYWFAAIGLTLVAILAWRVFPRELPAPMPKEVPTEAEPTLSTALKSEYHLPTAMAAIKAAEAGYAPPWAKHMSGQVVAEDGSPIADARIEAFNMQLRNEYTQSDANGAFTMPPMPAPGGIYFRVTASGYAKCPIEPSQGHVARDGSFEGIQLILEPESMASGVVLDAAGIAVVGDTVDIVSRDIPWDMYDSVTTDGSGAFTLRRLRSGNYYIRSEIAGRTPFHISRAEIVTGLVLRQASDPIYLSGVVTNTKGAPMRNATIYFNNVAVGAVSGDGQFSITRSQLDSLTGRIVAKMEEYSDSEVQLIETAALDLKLVLRPMSTVSGRVVYAKTGKPVTRFRVRAFGEVIQEWHRAANSARFNYTKKFTKVEDPQGRFNQVPGKAGTTGIEVFIHDFPFTVATIAPLQPGEARQGVVIQVAPGTRFEGRVLDHLGRPVRLAQVRAKGFPSEVGMSDVTGDDGLFLLGPFVDGPVELSVYADGMNDGTFSVNVSPAMPDVTTLNLTKKPTLGSNP